MEPDNRTPTPDVGDDSLVARSKVNRKDAMLYQEDSATPGMISFTQPLSSRIEATTLPSTQAMADIEILDLNTI